MGSECTSLPVIHFSDMKPATPEWETAKAQVVQHLQEMGVFEAKFDEIPLSLRQAVFSGMKPMFDLPWEHEKPHHGDYRNPEDTRYESFQIMDVNLPGKVEAYTTTHFFPDGNPTFNDNILSLVEKSIKMERIIRRMVMEGLGVEKYMDDHLQSSMYMLRFLKYSAADTQQGMVAHTDKNYITILYQNEVKGLDIQTKDGCWFTTEPSSTSCIVFAGDSFHAWTNGRLHSPLHRVVVNADEDRYSIGLFSNPKPGYIVKAPEDLVDEHHPLLFKPFDLHKFLEIGDVASRGSLKKYCGV